MKHKTSPGLKIISLNRKASFNFFFENIYEAGLVLKGSEIKSIRSGKVNIQLTPDLSGKWYGKQLNLD